MTPFDKETMRLLKDYINTMALTEADYLKEALKKIEEKKALYDGLSTKTDDLVKNVIDIRYKKLLTVSKESMDQVK